MVSSHPQISSKQKSVESADAAIGTAWGNYLPQVRLSADGGAEYTDSVDRASTQGKPYMRGMTDQSALTVTQHLYDGESISASVAQARATHGINQADLRSTRQNVLLEATNAYLNVLRYTHLVRLATEDVHTVQDQLNLEDERISKGAGMSLDALTAKQQLQTAKEARVRYEGKLRTAQASYMQVYGHPANIAEMVEPLAPVELLTESLDDAVETAQKHNPSVESALRTIDLQSERIRAAEAGFLPTVDLVGKGDYMHDKNAATGNRQDWSVLLTFSWDLFSGWKTRSQVAQNSFDHGAAMDTHRYTVRKTDELVRTKWDNLMTSRESMALLENASALAEEMVAATRKLHAAGKETIFNVLDSENRLNDARIKYAEAYYDMISATFDVLNAMGKLELDAIERTQSREASATPKPPMFLESRAHSTN